ncbi:MAG: FG-GAP repeat domain-containing protein [Pirellulales bacterium]
MRMSYCLLVSLAAAATTIADDKAASVTLVAHHRQLADLGGEHLAHAVFRHTPQGGAVVAWGERVVEWPLERPELRELVARSGETHYSNGGCALDVDGDGADEIVVARGRSRSCADPELVWLKDDGSSRWASHSIAPLGSGPIAPHDIAPFSFVFDDGRELLGVVLVIDRRVLVWYEIPADPNLPWVRHEIAELPVASQSGIAVGNLAGNGRPDVVCGTFWAECPRDPSHERWHVRRYSRWEDGGWGGMDKLTLADMNGDGSLDIVASEAEIPNARLGIFFRRRKEPDSPWECHEIEKGLYCPHSLVVVDLDGDHRTDLVVGEMTAGGWDFPLNPRPQIIAYYNRAQQPFKRQVLSEGWGVHEMGLAPGRNDGGHVLFAADEIQPQKFPMMKTHVSTWTITKAAP